MTQNRKSTTPTDVQRLAQLHRDLADIERARRDGLLSDKQYQAMRAAVLARAGQ